MSGGRFAGLLAVLIGLVYGVVRTDGAFASLDDYCGGNDLRTCAAVGTTYNTTRAGGYTVTLTLANLSVPGQVYAIHGPWGLPGVQRDRFPRSFGPRAKEAGVFRVSLVGVERGVQDSRPAPLNTLREQSNRGKYRDPMRRRRR